MTLDTIPYPVRVMILENPPQLFAVVHIHWMNNDSNNYTGVALSPDIHIPNDIIIHQVLQM